MAEIALVGDGDELIEGMKGQCLNSNHISRDGFHLYLSGKNDASESQSAYGCGKYLTILSRAACDVLNI